MEAMAWSSRSRAASSMDPSHATGRTVPADHRRCPRRAGVTGGRVPAVGHAADAVAGTPVAVQLLSQPASVAMSTSAEGSSCEAGEGGVL